MSHRKNSQGIFISQGAFLTCIFSAGYGVQRKHLPNYEWYFRSHLRGPWVPYQTLRTQCVKDRKESEKTFVWLIEVWFLCLWVTVRQRKPDFFLEECDPVCSKVLSSNCIDLHVYYFTQKTGKHVQLLLLPGSKILIQILQLIPFFLLGLYKAVEEALEFLLQTHLQKEENSFEMF